MRVGFVGTGTMGTPIASCLIAAGHSLLVYDQRPEATAELCAQGAERTTCGFFAARDSEVVFTSLPGPAEFEAAMVEPQTGILCGLQPGAAQRRGGFRLQRGTAAVRAAGGQPTPLAR